MKISPPDYLDKLALSIFDMVLPELGDDPSASDILMLGLYAQNASDYQRLTQTIQKDGDSLTDRYDEQRKHPLSIPQAKAFDQMTKAAVLLGIDRKTKTKGVSKPVENAKRSLRKPARSMKKVG